eukprot:g291.t1
MKTFFGMTPFLTLILAAFALANSMCCTSAEESTELSESSSFLPLTLEERHNLLPPWKRIKGGRTRVVYSHKIIDTKHESVSNLDAFVGAFARRYLQNLEVTEGQGGRRRLSAGDFDELNALFEGTIFLLPDQFFNFDVPWPFTSVDVFLTNMQCTDVSIDDMTVESSYKNNKEIDVSVSITGLAMHCTLDWRYDFGLIKGNGKAWVWTSNNRLSSTARFTSEDYATHGPTKSTIESCDVGVDVTNMHFQGGISGAILNLFKNNVMETTEEEIEAMACDEMSSMGSESLTSALEGVDEMFSQYLGPSVAPEDPLEAQSQLVVPDGTGKLVDFTNLEGSPIGDLITTALTEMNERFSTHKPDPETGASTLGINIIVRDTMLDANGVYHMDLNNLMGNDGSNVLFEGHDMMTQTTVTATAARVRGLDSFTRFLPLSAIGAQTFTSDMRLENVFVEIDVTVDMKPSSSSDSIIVNPSTPHQVEHLTIRTGLRAIEFSAAMLVAIDEDALGNLMLGSLLHTDHIVGCAMSTVVALEVPQLSVSVGDILTPHMTGFISHGLDTVLNNLALGMFMMYRNVMMRALPNYFEMEIRESVANAFLESYTNEEAAVCPPPQLVLHDGVVQDSGHPIIDFNALFYDPAKHGYGDETDPDTLAKLQPFGDIFAKAKKIFDDMVMEIDPETGYANLNTDFVGPYTEAQSNISGTMVWQKEPIFDTEMPLLEFGGLNSFKLVVDNARIENLDTISEPFHLMREGGDGRPFELDHALTMGRNPRPLAFAADVLFEIDGDAIDIRNHMTMSLNIHTLETIFSTLLMVNAAEFMTLKLKDIFNFDCWLATVLERHDGMSPTARLASIGLAFGSAALSVRCISCTASLFDDLDALLATEDAVNDTTRFANWGLNLAEEMLGSNETQARIDYMLQEAEPKCNDPTYVGAPFVPEESDAAIALMTTSATPDFSLAVAGLCLVVVLIALHCFVSSCTTKRSIQRQWRQTDDERREEALERERTLARKKMVNGRSSAMICSSVIPTFVRVLMPIIVVINIGLFLSGHLDIGAAVRMEMGFAGDTMTVPNFFEFSMAKSTIDTWNAGAKELAILILVFSGIWPYTKQLTVLFLWFAPPCLVTCERRGSIFQWLDALGKWSMIDIFVLVMSLVAFQVSVKSPEGRSYIPVGFYFLKLRVVPLWGLYANLIAQILSQISSHFIIYYHRNITAAAEQEQQRWDLRINSKGGSGGASGDDAGDPVTLKQRREAEEADGSSATKKRRRASTWVDMHGMESIGLDEEDTEEIVEARTSLRRHVFRVAAAPQVERDGRTWQRFQLGNRVSCLVLLLGAGAIFLLTWGCLAPSLSLGVWGILGKAIDLGETDGSISEYSVYTIVQTVLFQAHEMHYDNGETLLASGLVSLAVIFAICIYVVPTVQILVLCYLWSRSLTLRNAKRVYVLCEILSAWQYMEVYLCGVLLAVFQLGQISAFMLNEHCGAMGSTFAMMVDLELIELRNAQCFYLYAEAEYGSYILLGAAALLFFINTLVGDAAAAAIEDREYRAFCAAASEKCVAGSGVTCGNPGPSSANFRWMLTISPTLFGAGTRLRRRGWLQKDSGKCIMVIDGGRNIVSDVIDLTGTDGETIVYHQDIESGTVLRSKKWEVLLIGNSKTEIYFNVRTGHLSRTKPSMTSWPRTRKKLKSCLAGPHGRRRRSSSCAGRSVDGGPPGSRRSVRFSGTIAQPLAVASQCDVLVTDTKKKSKTVTTKKRAPTPPPPLRNMSRARLLDQTKTKKKKKLPPPPLPFSLVKLPPGIAKKAPVPPPFPRNVRARAETVDPDSDQDSGRAPLVSAVKTKKPRLPTPPPPPMVMPADSSSSSDEEDQPCPRFKLDLTGRLGHATCATCGLSKRAHRRR